MAYIERETLLEKMKTWNTKERLIDCVNDMPDADVVEVRHGEWISASKKQGVNCGMKCSLCGARIKYSEFFNGNHNYCHKCGAKMDGKDGE